MQKLLVLVSLCVLSAGCQSSKVTVLTPTKFVKHFSEKRSTKEGDSTNETASLQPRLISPGMVLTVTVEEDRSLNRQYTVPPSGIVDFAAVGNINVVGLTADEVADKSRIALERDFFQKAHVAVTIESAASSGGGTGAGCVIYVLGAINRPGPLLLPQNEAFTIAKAIIAAGNFTQFGNGSKVRLIRYDENGRKFETRVNVTRILKVGEFENDVPLQCNDWIIVPEKIISF